MKHYFIALITVLSIDMEDRPGNTELITVNYTNGSQDKIVVPRNKLGSKKVEDFVLEIAYKRMLETK